MKWWNNEQLGMNIALDTETEMITHPSHTPRLVLSSAHSPSGTYLIRNEDLSAFLYMNIHANFIMHNAPFDLAVISKFTKDKSLYKHTEEDHLYDTRIMYQLIKLAETGISPQKNSLALVAKEYLGIEIDKDKAIRCNFGSFLKEDGTVSYQDIPQEFLEYAAKDAEITYEVWKELTNKVKQIERQYSVEETHLSHKIQLLGAIALDGIQKNGIGFNLKGKEERLLALEEELRAHKELLASHGWERGKKGIKKIFADITKGIGLNLPLTESGQVSSSSDTLAEYIDKHPFINSYVKFHELEKLGTFIREIESDRIYPKYNLLMNTGRTSSYGPNIQQLPRGGGIRELFIPSEGNVFLDIDYSYLEVCTLAQHLYNDFKDTTLMDALNAGYEPHYFQASKIHRIPISEVKKEQRHLAKIANFGFPANMSPATFVDYCKGYGTPMTEDQSIELKKAWASTIPSIRRFWQIGNKTTNVLTTGRVRANCTYTALLNTYFQGLAADGAKLALYLLWKEGFKVVAFVHDQVLIEVPEKDSEKLLLRAQELMIKGMNIVTPDIKLSTEGKITTKFTK